MTPREIDQARWPQLSPLLDELLDLPVTARPARLAILRTQDAALADDLSALLERLQPLDDAGFLEAPALAAPPGLAGQAVGAYRLLQPLGQGGMGSVWLAERCDGRYAAQVAIKFMHSGLLGAADARRFLREGQLLARLDHPHIARLLDAGVHQGEGGLPARGQPYLVLEYVQGQPIDRHCDSLQLDLRARVALMHRVLQAVAHAHSRLILHRDLKPSNILVSADGQPKLLDFGIGKLLDSVAQAATDADSAAAATELTQAAGRAYTERWAAPEQLLGQEVTTATDVYALGVLLYELLGGGHPTEPAQATALTRLQAAVEAVPPRLSDALLRRGGNPRPARLLRGDLDTIVARALKKQPAERYAHAAALADDLQRWLDDEPVSARPDSRAHRLGRWVRRHARMVGVAGTAAAVALSGGAAAALWQARQAEAQRAKAESLVAFLVGDLKDKLNLIGRLDLMQAVGERVLAHYGDTPAAALDDASLARRAHALRLVGEAARLRMDNRQAQQGFDQAAAATALLLAQAPGDGQRLLEHVDSLERLHEVAVARGDPVAELAMARQANALLHRAAAQPGAPAALRMKAMNSEQNLAYSLNRNGQAEAALQRLAAARAAAAALPADTPGLLRERGDQELLAAQALQSLGRYEAAARGFAASLALLESEPQLETDVMIRRQRAMVRRSLALAWINAGQLDAAGPVVAALQASLLKAAPADLHQSPMTHEDLSDRVAVAEYLLLQGQREAARTQLAPVVAFAKGMDAGQRDNDVWYLSTCGQMLALQARLGAAARGEGAGADLPAMRELLASVARAEARGQVPLGLALQGVLKVGVALGDALQQAGQTQAAQQEWQAVVRRAQPALRQGLPPALLPLAQAEWRLGQGIAARERALRLRAAGFGHPDLAMLLQQIADAPDRSATVASQALAQERRAP